MWNYRLSRTDASTAGTTTGGEEGEAGTISLDSSNVDIRVEEITEMTNMAADNSDTRGRITMNFALLLAAEEGDRISRITTTDDREGKIATAATTDTETTTTLRREGAMEGIEGEVGVAEDVVTMTTT